jgi:hypothetical protein
LWVVLGGVTGCEVACRACRDELGLVVAVLFADQVVDVGRAAGAAG